MERLNGFFRRIAKRRHTVPTHTPHAQRAEAKASQNVNELERRQEIWQDLVEESDARPPA